MMIAAAHLRTGDVITPVCPPSDEAAFDVIYNGPAFAPDVVVSVVYNDQRADNRSRRYIHLSNSHARCWDVTRLIDVQRTL